MNEEDFAYGSLTCEFIDCLHGSLDLRKRILKSILFIAATSCKLQSQVQEQDIFSL